MPTLNVTVHDTLRDLIADPKHGRLPALLLLLTIVTGVVDAVSILQLGRVFVANMTGNVVFVGFAVAGAPGFSLSASLVALAGFIVGAGSGAPLIRRFGSKQARLLAVAVTVELTFVLMALILAAVAVRPLPGGVKVAMAGLLAIAMGLQNATARWLAVPDLTTTVLTMALTGIAADIRSGSRTAVTRRVLSVATMFGGAVAGAELVLHGEVTAALGVAVGILCLVDTGAIIVMKNAA